MRFTEEEIQRNDWSATGDETPAELRQKAIEAYWLSKWYQAMAKHTFQTWIVPVGDLESFTPDPALKYAVRWENKSPKDSDYWGPLDGALEPEKFHDAVRKVFRSSLRCRGSAIPGEFYCFREWVPLEPVEFRCFWNRQLVAVGAETWNEGEFSVELADQIRKYTEQIAPDFPYYRCVFDLGRRADTGELVFIEFNSFQTNSGAYPFDWVADADVFWPGDDGAATIHYRWGKKELIL